MPDQTDDELASGSFGGDPTGTPDPEPVAGDEPVADDPPSGNMPPTTAPPAPTADRGSDSFEQLRGDWLVTHDAGTTSCPGGLTLTIPGGDPQLIHIDPGSSGQFLFVTGYEDSSERLEFVLEGSGPGGSSWLAAGEFGGVVIAFTATFTDVNGPYMFGDITSTVEGCEVYRGYSARPVN